jgi:type II secretory ATPase GspE/PulE/Tfp pilus assembly ATPase PilB-like protein
VAREYATQCWSCLGEFDAAGAVWCTCSSRTPTKLCPFCIHCFCQADAEYQENFWRGAPEELKEEREILKGATGTIGEALIRSNLLNTDQLVAALRWQQSHESSLDQALLDLGFVSRENLDLVAHGPALGGATVDLSKQLVDASLVSAITVDLCYRKRILPISKEEIGGKEVLTLAMAGPTDVETIDQIQSLTNCRIIPMSASEEEILDRLKDLFPKEVATCVSAEATGPSLSRGREPMRSGARAPGVAPSPPVPAAAALGPPARRKGARAPARGAVRSKAAAAPSILEEIDEIVAEETQATPAVVAVPVAARAQAAAAAPQPQAGAAAADEAGAALQKILSEAIARKASLVQVEVRGTSMSLFLRIDGTLYRVKPPALESPAALARALAARASLPPGAGAATGRIPLKAGERRIELVVRRLPFSGGGESLLMKIVDPADFLRSLEDLGPSPHDRERILRALALPSGLVLLSGPLHNGVEVTRHSLMAHLAREGRRVLAVEAPTLLPVEGVRQQEIPPPGEAGQARAAIEALQGTEVLFLPDLGAPGLAALAVEKAASCLVIAPIQARRASQTPGALLWHAIDPQVLSSVLRLVLSQRLVRKVCEGCRAPVQVADKVLKMMGLTPDEALDLAVYQGSGCEKCGPLSPGYSGRLALFEVMEGTADIASLIGAKASPGEIEREARRGGMSPLRAACLAQVGQGVTTLEEFQKGNF